MYLLIDNFDSFSYMIAGYFQDLGKAIATYRSDRLNIETIRQLNPTGIILSPGPKRPEDAFLCRAVMEHLSGLYPILGVCLGMQVMAYTAGATVCRGPRPMHGKCTAITHTGHGLFHGLPSPMTVTRYHSLIVEDGTLPPAYTIDARADDSVIMAISHQTLPIYGVQFHPEAVLTEYGHELFANFCHLAERKDMNV